jgi:hypothetical protein
MAVPNTFAGATAAIPLSQLDQNFATTITLGNTAIQLGNTVTTLNNMTFANVTITSVGTTFPNNYLANSSVTLGNTSVSLGSTASNVGNLTLINTTVTNYTETPFTANSSTAITLALTNGTFQIVTLTGNATITMPTATSGKSFLLLLKQDGTGGRTVTWSTVKWPGNTAPTITSTASRQDIFSFFADGTNWYGVTVSQNYTP